MSGGGKQPEATVSKYHLGVQFLICHGCVDNISEIYVDKKLAWSGTAVDTVININKPDLFGGTTREGGVVGNVAIASGKSTQVPDTYLTSKLGTIPAFRGVTTAILRQVYVGLNYYLKAWTFVGSRIHNQLNGTAQWRNDIAEIGSNQGLMNPIHMIREMLISPYMGYGYAPSRLNNTLFEAAAQTCYNENLGLAFLVTSGTVSDFISDVLRHIQASLYQNRKTGLIEIKLIRHITDTGSLFVMDKTNTNTISNLKRTVITELVSSVTVQYESNVTHESDSVTISDLALYQQQDTPVEKTIKYSGVATAELARKFAARDLLELSNPLYSCTISGTKALETLNIGDAFILNRPDVLDRQLVLRVLSIELGDSLTNRVTIKAIEDIFQAATVGYAGNAGISSWVDPINNPQPIQHYGISEVPYYSLAKLIGDTEVQSIVDTESVILAYGVSPTPDSIQATIRLLLSGEYQFAGTMFFCMNALLNGNIDKSTTNIPIKNVDDLDQLTTTGHIQINSEIMSVVSFTDTNITVKRGVLDTVPAVHSVDDRIYGWGDFFGSTEKTYLVGETLSVKLTPTTPRGELPVGDATATNVTLQGRLHKPYPPANVKINDLYWPATINTSIASVSLPISWATRDRIQQTEGYIGFYEGSISTEVGVEYFGELRRTDTNVILTSFSNVSGTSTDISTVYIGEVKLRIWSVRGSFTSWQVVEHIFEIIV